MVSQKEQKYGIRGKKGHQGERDVFNEFLIPFYGRNYVKDLTRDRTAQSRGIDFSVTKPEWNNWYTLDVKSNLEKYGSDWIFWLEVESFTKDHKLKPGWFRHSEANRIYHYCRGGKCCVYYDLNQMRQRIDELGMMTKTVEVNNDYLIKIYANDSRFQDLFQWLYM